MKKSMQYDIRIVQDDTGWVADIIRRVTTKKTTVTLSQSGFTTEADALAWAQEKVNTFTQKRHINKTNKRQFKQHEG